MKGRSGGSLSAIQIVSMVAALGVTYWISANHANLRGYFSTK